MERIEYPVDLASIRTPKGKQANWAYRLHTNDWNTLNASLGPNDEYGTAGLALEGWALDIGGYLGSVGIALAIDNPSLHVVIVEPVPDNQELIERNVALNDVADRVTLVKGAAGGPGITTSEIRYRYVGDPNLEHHAFVGNTSLAYDHGGETPHLADNVNTFGLDVFLDEWEVDPVFTKIDCEGGEWEILTSPELNAHLPYIVGEAHAVRGHRGRDIVDVLKETHRVELIGTGDGTIEFKAWRR